MKKSRIIASIVLSFTAMPCLNAQTAYTLAQVIDSARANNIAMRNAERNVASAREQHKEAFTKYFPTVSGTGGWFDAAKSLVSADINLPGATPMRLNLVKDGFLGSVTATQPVFAGGRIVNNNKLARVGEDVSRLQMRLSTDEVDRTAEQYFWQMVTLEEKLKTIASVEQMLGDIHKDVDISVKAGVTLRNDLLQVELRQNDVESQKLTLNNSLRLVRMLLAQYCGLADTAFSVAYNAKAAAPTALKCDHNIALPQTAEYQLLGKQVEAARLQKKITLGDNLPTVAVGAGVNYNNITRSRGNSMVFATVSLPITDWWGGSHANKRRSIEYQKAVDQQRDNAQLLLIKMQNAWNKVEEAYKQVGIGDRSIEQAEENLRINRNMYSAGTINMSDLLDAETYYQQAHDRRTEAFADYQNAITLYRQAVGQ